MSRPHCNDALGLTSLLSNRARQPITGRQADEAHVDRNGAHVTGVPFRQPVDSTEPGERFLQIGDFRLALPSSAAPASFLDAAATFEF